MRLDLDGLADAPREALMSEWRKVVGCPPPKHLSKPLMVQTLSHDYEHSPGLLKPNCRIGGHTHKDSLTHARRHGAGLAQQQRRRLTFVHAHQEISVTSNPTLRHLKKSQYKHCKPGDRIH